ncbi:AfsR/SARP family transcriptional regulator [Saccharopolyspora phatthalungensis]|uniref:DNA-binding SARP family transcriptional activator n=1 Tax=Saccharopolyspora phatthalungensis TaxID=664693 RepID=A0A840QIE6_9PSEU|nr:BTAD domain-containing putative transcriptional regulator [Saccharopolyspora phatthalungensis]MBB5158489.1 DNA-binding SARP family transcriptional activator [Saccharopolyspora phatthalungensis]
MTDRLEFGLLGPLRLEFNEQRIAIGGPRQRIVLAMLLLNADRVVSIDRISEAIWNGHPPATARTQVAICVAELRKTIRSFGLRDDVLLTSSPGYMLRRAEHEIDLLSFRAKVAEARTLANRLEIRQATERYDEALALWRGRALCDINSALVEIEVERLEEQKLAVQEERTALHLQLGRHRELISELTALVEDKPLREQTRAQLMLAQYRAGRRAEAMETFRQGRQYFIDEIGLEPGPVLQELHEAILNDDPSVREPQRQRRSTPPTATAANAAPSDIVPFGGRKTELSTLDELRTMRQANVGLITGSAGIGKSALAVHWAHRMADEFPGGVLYANLHECCRPPARSDAQETLHQLLRQLGVPATDIPSDLDTAATLYQNLARERKTLVLLDNVASYQQIEHVLPSGSPSKALVTSRSQLGELVASALWLRLQPIGHPEAVDLLGTLIGRRAEAAPRAVAELAELCGRLPAALRIAATKLIAKPHWTIQRLANRLSDPHTRLDHLEHGEQRLRGRLQSSYQRLSPEVARMFRLLGRLKTAEFSLHDASTLLQLDPGEAEHLIESLVDAHLLEGVPGVDTDEVRYEFQPLLRVFAAELDRGEVRTAETARSPRLVGKPELRFAM